MQEEWVHIPDFPGYMISNHGRVSHPDGRILVNSPVQYNIPTVGLRLDGDPKVYRRAVPLLVAAGFLPEPDREDFDTPIHLDGDRSNPRADNLAWRPRWFAIQFHKDRRHTDYPNWQAPIILVETGEKFPTVHEAAQTYGELEKGIHSCLINPRDAVWPHGHHYVYAD